MSSRDRVVVEGVECILFPIPADTEGDRLKDAEFFLNCAFSRLYYLNQPDQQRSRELSLAVTNLQQAQHWFATHVNRVENGIPNEPIMLESPPKS